VSATTELIDQLTRHGLTDPDRLWDYLAQQGGPSRLPADVQQVAELFVQAGLLTAFQAQQLLAGSGEPLVVSRYRVLQTLGKHTYLGQRPDGRRAVLQMRAPQAPRPVTRPHPNLVPILDFETQAGRFFVIREYVVGRSLEERCQSEGPLAPVPAARALLDAARGLSHLHVAGLAHGAIEPSHLIEDQTGTVRLLPGVGGAPEDDLIALGQTLAQLTGARPLPLPLQAVVAGLGSAEAVAATLEGWLREVAPPPLIEPKRPSSQGALPRPDLSQAIDDLNEPLPDEPASQLPLLLLSVLALLTLSSAALLWWVG
jgi:serine/threonine protein kinase